MTTLFTKDFFIVFDRNWEDKKHLSFNLNFFYLKSFKKKSKSFSYISDPFFRGIIVFGLDYQDKFQPVSFSKIQKDGNSQPINPRLFKKFLLDVKAKFVAFSDQTEPDEFKPVKEMLKNLHFGEDKILN
ncbi:MAG: hypothetical protein ACTSQL_06500, partial [Promethearchaeota archaeon]